MGRTEIAEKLSIKLISFDNIIYCFILAIGTLCFLPTDFLLPNLTAGLIALSLAVCALLLNYWAWRRTAVWLFRCAIFFICLAYAHQTALNALQSAQIPTQKMQAKFRIVEIHHQQGYQAVVLQTQATPTLAAKRIYASWKVEQVPQLGEIWQGELQLRPISSRLNQGGFDRQAWYFSKHIHAWASVKSAVKISEDFSWREQRFAQSLQQTTGLAQQGLLLALGFGERAWLPTPTWQLYQQTNTAHLIAISGLHIGLAMALGFWFGRAVQYILPTRWISPLFPLLSGLLLAFLYAELAGFAIPTFRAMLALAVVFLCRFGRVYYTAWQLYFRVIALLLLCDPLMILSASFWLSVGAVGCLISWYQIFPLNRLEWRGQRLSAKVRWIFALFHLQLGLFCLFTPIQLALFAGFSLHGFFANLLIVPLYSFLLVPVVLVAVLSQGEFSSWQIADFLADQITQLLTFFQRGWLNLSAQQSQMLSVMLALIMCGLVWLLHKKPKQHSTSSTWLYQKRPRYFSLKTDRTLAPNIYWRWQCVLVGFICVCLGKSALNYVEQSDWRVETLDVGQGLATLIVANQRGILYDTGASWADGSMAEIEILPYLQRQGISLDYVVISHDDNDHSGGAKAIFNAFPQATLISSSTQNYQEKHRSFCIVGAQWHWQGLQIQALSPSQIVERAENAHSCVLLVQDQYANRLLLTGDVDIATENQILSQLAPVKLLQVGHHGSKTSTGERLVAQIKPQVALVSSGRWNPWHFPNKTVVERLMRAKSAVYNTAVSGQISAHFKQGKMKIIQARNAYSPWFSQMIMAETLAKNTAKNGD
ncbi:hypothetical protein A4G18_00845 [Pasteurellaceae bacterium Pebbles2]|nr:hypothetical protein [Pasteurellaceae bacterium Pebbles2]